MEAPRSGGANLEGSAAGAVALTILYYIVLYYIRYYTGEGARRIPRPDERDENTGRPPIPLLPRAQEKYAVRGGPSLRLLGVT